MQRLMHAARRPATSILLCGSDCLVLGGVWGVAGVEQDNPRTVLHDSGAGIPCYSVLQAGSAIFYTRGKHALIIGYSAPECFIFRDLIYMLVLFSSDCHSPDFTPAYDRPSTDQVSSAILSLYSRVLAIASSKAFVTMQKPVSRMGSALIASGFSEPWINMHVHRLSLASWIDEF